MNAMEKIHTQRVLTLIQHQLEERLIAHNIGDPDEMLHQTKLAMEAQLEVLKIRQGIHAFEVQGPMVIHFYEIVRRKQGMSIIFTTKEGKLVMARNSFGRMPDDQFYQRGIHSARTAKRFAQTQLGAIFFIADVVPSPSSPKSARFESVISNA